MRALLLVLVFVAACHDDAPKSRAVSATDAGKLLIDRNWVDRFPDHINDKLHVVRFVPSMGGGVFQDRTAFRGEFELFAFHAHGDVIDLHLPHTGDNLILHYQIERVSGPEPFDLKLTLDRNPRGPTVYYSVSAQHGTTAAELDAQLPQSR